MVKRMVPVGISNRHLHVSQADLDVLFGQGHELVNFKDLKQPGQYACEEKVDLVGPKGTIKGVRILGPVRNQTQVEVSITDGFTLGVKPPVRGSGDLDGSPGVKLVGPKGEVTLEKGVIAAERHIHMHTSEAETFGITDRQRVSVLTGGERSVVFHHVLVRVHPEFALEFHVDVDEGNAAGLKNGVEVEIL